MINNTIGIQIKCMKKLNIPQNKIDECLYKYNNHKSILLKKLIECEKKYAEYNSMSIEERNYNNCDNSFKSCLYFCSIELKCKLDLECGDECEKLI